MNPAAGDERDASAAYCGRFAPSPTGPLHFGSLVAALASRCDALAARGRWLVRIEDVDQPRTQPGAAATILATLERYGFAWDGPVVYQSERTALYADALAHLASSGQVYPCACTRRELADASLGPGGEPIYPGTCRHGIPAEHRRRTQRAWRLRSTDGNRDRVVTYVDRATGPQCQDLAREVGDFVVRRADGLFAYQLAVVVDDAAQGVNAVVRGADLASSTARQIHLQRLLGYPTPAYLHVPVALDHAGRKLSKQTRAAPLPETPLPTLLAAWRFLGQALAGGSETPATVAEFWAHASTAWTPERLP